MISEETDLIEPSLLDELICHISSLASVYHRPPSSFVAGKSSQKRAALPSRVGGDVATPADTASTDPSGAQPTLSQMAGSPPQVAAAPPPTTDSLLGDLLEIGPSSGGGMPPMQQGGDIFGAPMQPAAPQPSSQSMIFFLFVTVIHLKYLCTSSIQSCLLLKCIVIYIYGDCIDLVF